MTEHKLFVLLFVFSAQSIRLDVYEEALERAVKRREIDIELDETMESSSL